MWAAAAPPRPSSGGGWQSRVRSSCGCSTPTSSDPPHALRRADCERCRAISRLLHLKYKFEWRDGGSDELGGRLPAVGAEAQVACGGCAGGAGTGGRTDRIVGPVPESSADPVGVHLFVVDRGEPGYAAGSPVKEYGPRRPAPPSWGRRPSRFTPSRYPFSLNLTDQNPESGCSDLSKGA